MADFYLKKGDLLPWIKSTLRDSTGAAINLSGGTVAFRMRAVNGAIKINLAAAVVTDAPGGKVEYRWAGSDTDTPGDYAAEWVLLFGTAQQIVPNDRSISIRISDSLA